MTEDARWLDAEQQRSWRALIMGWTLLNDQLDADLRREFDISLAEYEVLGRLSEHGGAMRMAQLADSMAHSRSRVTHTVGRLEQAKLVQRRRHGDDRRGVEAVLTEDGWDLLRRAAPVHVQGVRDNLVDRCSPEDFAALGRVMNAVADNLICGRPGLEMR